MTVSRRIALPFVLSLAFAACSDDPVAGDPGADVAQSDASDSGAIDSGASDAGTDVRDDASGLPTFEPRDVIAGVLIVNGVDPGSADGLEACVYEYLEQTSCAVISASQAVIEAPVGEPFRILLRGDGVVPSLTQVGAQHTADEPLLALAAPEDAFASSYASAAVTPDEAEGTAMIFMRPTTLDPRAQQGMTAQVVSGDAGEVVYTNADSDFDPAATVTAGYGTTGFFGAQPGAFEVTVSSPLTGCTASAHAAWENPDTDSTFDVVIVPGMITMSLIACEDFEPLDALECDVTANDCPDPESKCRLNFFQAADGTDATGTTCVAPGDRGLDEDCSRVTGEPGNDDCGEDLFCANWDVEPGLPRVCREYCMTNADCAVDDICQGLGGLGGRVVGLCIPTCSPFEPRCAEGLTCVPLISITPEQAAIHGFCGVVGDVEVGEVCGRTDQELCVSGAACVQWSDGQRHCSVACNEEHPCDTRECIGDPTGDFDLWSYCRE